MKDPVTIRRRLEHMKLSLYGDRNTQYQVNKWAYEGDFDRIMGTYSQSSWGGLDDRKRRSSKLQSWNLMKPVVDFTIIQLARPPAIRVPNAKPGDESAKTKATLVEHFLYWLWDQSFMGTRHMEMGFNMGCYGTAVHELEPDFEREIITFKEWAPEYCYPMPKGDGQTFEYVCFAWSEDAESLVMRYPKLKDKLPRKGNRYERYVEVIKYWDKEDHGFVLGDKFVDELPGYTHNLGFVPVAVTPAIKTPGASTPFGPADIDQLIAVNILLNSLRTKTYDALEENLYPMIFTIGDEELPVDPTPGQVNYLGPPGSDVKRLDPPTIPREVWLEMREFEDFVRTHANWSKAWSGELDQSQASGQAIRRLQSPGMGMAGIRQELLGQDLQLMNRYWLAMTEHFFGDKEYDCMADGVRSMISAPGKPTQYNMMVVPERDIGGYHRNILEYAIFGADLNQTLVAIQQLKQMGFASTEWGMSQIPGITDEQGMRDQIEAEKRREIQFEGELQALLEKIKTDAIIAQQQAMVQAKAQMQAMEQGGGQPGAAPGGGAPPVPGNVTVMPGGQPQVMGVGEPLAPPEGQQNQVGGLPYTNLKPFGQALNALSTQRGAEEPPPQAAPEEAAAPAGPTEEREPTMVTAEEVTEAIQGIGARIESGEIRSRSGGIKGDVWLLGDLASRGRAMGGIEIGVSVSADGQLITNALPQYRGRLKIQTFTRPPALGRGVQIVKGGENVAVSETTEAA